MLMAEALLAGMHPDDGAHPNSNRGRVAFDDCKRAIALAK
jgi:hypothetical protein